MDLKQIHYFIALFEHGSVTRAAKRLNIVQPALSMQIAKLEEELQQQLFERVPHGMAPTAAGRMMYRLFLPIVRDIDHARDQLVQRDEMGAGTIALGLIASVTESVLADSLSRFNARYPQMEVTISDGYSATLIDWVAGGQLDVAIVNRPRARMALLSELILDEEMVLATGTAQGPVLPPTIELARLQELDLVLPSKRHGLRGVLDAAAQHADVILHPKVEIDLLGTIVDFVAATRFATVLPRIAVQRALVNGSVLVTPILAPRIVRQIVRIHHPRRPLNRVTTALVEMIGAEIRRVSEATMS